MARHAVGRRAAAAAGDAPGAELFAQPWPASAPTRADFRAALADPGRGPSRVPAGVLGLQRHGRAASAVENAQRHLEQGYRARRDVPPFRLRLPIDWAADPHRDDNWRVQLNMLRLLDPFIQAHEASGAAEPLRQALDYVFDWHRFHLVEGRRHAYAWRDMMTGVRSLRLAYLAERARLGTVALADAQVDLLATLLHEHWQRLTQPGFFRYTNHTIWDLHALSALLRVALADGDTRFEPWQATIGQRLDQLVERQFDAHGVHRENSPQYHFVAAAMFRALHASGWYAGSSALLAPTLERAGRVDAWMRFPDGRVLPIGDSDGSAPTVRALPAPSRDLPGDRTETLNHSGYCMVRRLGRQPDKRWSMLAIKAGFDLPGHKHHDLLSYVWSESGCDIVVDAAKFAYDRSPMRDYIRSNRAHNLIEFDERDCDIAPEHRTGHAVQALTVHDWGASVSVALTHQPLHVAHERRYHFAPGRWLVTVDRFEAPSALAFTHFTHLAPEFHATPRAGDGFDARHADGGRLVVAHWADVALRAEVRRAEPGLRPQGWVSRGYRQVEPCPTLALTGRAARATVVMALSLDPQGRLATRDGGRPIWSCRAVELALDTR